MQKIREYHSIKKELAEYIKYNIQKGIISNYWIEYIPFRILERGYIKTHIGKDQNEKATINKWMTKHAITETEIKEIIKNYENKNNYEEEKRELTITTINMLIYVILEELDTEIKSNNIKELEEKLTKIINRENKNIEEEYYKTIPSNKNYKASNKGNIKNNKGQILKQSTTPKGYRKVYLYKKGKRELEYINYLVANTFMKYKKCKGLKPTNITWNRTDNNINNIKIIVLPKRKMKRKTKLTEEEQNTIENKIIEKINKFNTENILNTWRKGTERIKYKIIKYTTIEKWIKNKMKNRKTIKIYNEKKETIKIIEYEIIRQ